MSMGIAGQEPVCCGAEVFEGWMDWRDAPVALREVWGEEQLADNSSRSDAQELMMKLSMSHFTLDRKWGPLFQTSVKTDRWGAVVENRRGQCCFKLCPGDWYLYQTIHAWNLYLTTQQSMFCMIFITYLFVFLSCSVWIHFSSPHFKTVIYYGFCPHSFVSFVSSCLLDFPHQ